MKVFCMALSILSAPFFLTGTLVVHIVEFKTIIQVIKITRERMSFKAFVSAIVKRRTDNNPQTGFRNFSILTNLNIRSYSNLICTRNLILFTAFIRSITKGFNKNYHCCIVIVVFVNILSVLADQLTASSFRQYVL